MTNPINARDQAAQQIGTLVLANVELSAQAQQLSQLLESRHELLAQLIRSDAMPHEQVQQVMADQIFARWYAARYPQT